MFSNTVHQKTNFFSIFRESGCAKWNSGRVEITNDVVSVRCHKTDNEKKTLAYENVYGTYVPGNVKGKLKYDFEVTPLSVLMVIIDSVTRSNLLRLMPKTALYLEKNNFFWFDGYSQVGKATLMNVMPLLTGYSPSDLMKHFQAVTVNYYDQYDFTWYDYQKYGYVTAFAEDMSYGSTFNYDDAMGFQKQPTDYYFRPFSLASDAMNTTMLDKMPHCNGYENSGKIDEAARPSSNGYFEALIEFT